MSPCSLGKDFWAVASFLLQWKPRKRAHKDEPGRLCPTETAFLWVALRARIAVEMCWARRGLGLISLIAITAKCRTWIERRSSGHQKEGKPSLRFLLAKSSPGRCIEHFWSPVATCRQPPLPPPTPVLLGGLNCSTVKYLTNQRLPKQLINNNFAH